MRGVVIKVDVKETESCKKAQGLWFDMSQGLRYRQRRVWFDDLYSPLLPHRQEKFCFVCFSLEYFHLANKVIKKKERLGNTSW